MERMSSSFRCAAFLQDAATNHSRSVSTVLYIHSMSSTDLGLNQVVWHSIFRTVRWEHWSPARKLQRTILDGEGTDLRWIVLMTIPGILHLFDRRFDPWEKGLQIVQYLFIVLSNGQTLSSSSQSSLIWHWCSRKNQIPRVRSTDWRSIVDRLWYRVWKAWRRNLLRCSLPRNGDDCCEERSSGYDLPWCIQLDVIS